MAEKTRLAISIDVTGIPQLTKLKAALNNASASSKVLGGQFGRTRNELKLLERSIKPSINSTRALRDSFRELASQVEFGGRAFKQATREADRLDKRLAKMEKRRAPRFGAKGIAQTAGTIAAGGVFGGVEGGLGAAGGALLGSVVPGIGTLAGAAAGAAFGAQIGALRQAAGAAAEYAAALQKQRIALVGVTTSNEEYKIAIDAIRQATQDYALPQDIVTRQFTKLQASVQGAGGDIEDTKKAFDGIVAAVRATGGSLQDVDSALTATAQVFSKGKVSAEELRQQIGERLPGAFTLFADSMGKTPAELDKALEKGEVTLLDFLKFVEDNIERYKENAKAIADSPAAAGDRLKRDLGNLSESVGRLLAPIGAAFQNIFSEIVKVITRATNALARFFNMAFDQAKYEQALVTIADYEALEMTGGLQTGKGGRAREKAYKRAKEMVALQTSLMQGPGAGVVRPEAGGGFTGIDLDGTGAAGAAAKDISFALREAQIAALRETNDERRLALEFEARLIQIQESGLEPNKRAVELQKALVELDRGRIASAEKLRKVYQSFKIKDGEGFDFTGITAGEEQKTPFDAFREGADKFTDSLKGTLGAAKELAEVGLRGISDGIVELVTNGTLNFREFAANLLRDMARIIMQQIVVKSLMTAIGFGTNAVTQTDYSKFFPSKPGEFPIPKFAKGGITRGVSIAGEAGPEAVVPLPDGRSIPVTMQGEGTKVVVNVDAKGTSAQGDTGRANQLGEAIGAAVRQELLKQKRPGGLLA
jgi:tape measure domain-containing protein